ncbi:hypothetical protein [Salegentibacter salegens]|uniref:Uncharacterized protein n=1 Tax=Salegentibacter salegens TaxID=143223 RepID=A0A1M7N0Y5_9FLAO|nr:hypothetical protein [Salegentibacter salegens]PRX52413.1 hypothetical protein LY58_00052 [Salegentibacter salegens]SHM96590.1 hypothetical protein SAMN05878281_2781 [Salegentibacter salegens]
MQVDFKKFELLDWLKDLEDENVLNEIKAIKDRNEEFDFDKEWENGLTGEEFKAEMRKRINKYPWKK